MYENIFVCISIYEYMYVYASNYQKKIGTRNLWYQLVFPHLLTGPTRRDARKTRRSSTSESCLRVAWIVPAFRSLRDFKSRNSKSKEFKTDKWKTSRILVEAKEQKSSFGKPTYNFVFWIRFPSLWAKHFCSGKQYMVETRNVRILSDNLQKYFKTDQTIG